jgi:serine/threonine-protein kinase
MLGRVFNNRYRLKEKIGSGGMSDVYLADDQLLSREVAVKVLHPELARDPSYIQRFRYEAQAAANLNHPNIVNIYDWGNEGDIYYIVMEYVEGRSLSDLLRREGKLLPERAAEIAAEIAAALQFAHRRNLVHRDIKPHNIIITPTGQVKVMDFGIARTSTGTGMTQTGVVMGTAQYISPEQAQGLSVDGRSDIYSLGILLYEMLTGRVPFDDENPITVAYRQVKDDPMPPSLIDREIPPTIEAIVMKALAKNPDNRYQTAQEMKADLLRFIEGIPVSATPVLPTQQLTTGEPTAILPPYSAEEKKTPGWVWALIIGIGVLVVVGIILALVLAGPKPMVDVPNVIGMNVEEARQALESVGLKMEIKEEQYITSEGQQPDKVISQDPEWGLRITKGSTVSVVVTRELRIPNLVGMTQEEAEAKIRELKLAVGEVKSTPTKDESKMGKVLKQSPAAGTLATPGSAVDLEIGKLLSKVVVPNVKGKTASEAESILTSKNLKVNKVEQQSQTVAKGKVIDQDPEPGTTIYEEDTVTIYVSIGVEVPNVVGYSGTTAKNTLEALGLNVTVVDVHVVDPTDPDIGKVVEQNPPANTLVDPGSDVTIKVKKFP